MAKIDELTNLRETWPLNFWNEGWNDVKRKLDWMEENGCTYSPNRKDIFRAFNLCSYADCRVCFLGQDPYLQDATGVAFSVGEMASIPGTDRPSIPPSLKTILRELERHVGSVRAGWSSVGCLEDWSRQGVLLANATPTIEYIETLRGRKGYTHKYWPEWQTFNREVIRKLSYKGKVVFCFFGKRAQEYAQYVDEVDNTVLKYVHPSPRVQHWTNHPLVGSRLFDTVNAELIKYGVEPIDWRLW